MAELIHQYKTRLTDGEGVEYTAQAWGDRMENGTWKGWFVFRPLDDVHERLRTSDEIEQPRRLDLSYWASRVAQDHLEDAFQRAEQISDTVVSG